VLITFIPALGDLCNKKQKLDVQRLKFVRFLYLAEEIATSKRVNKRPSLIKTILTSLDAASLRLGVCHSVA